MFEFDGFDWDDGNWPKCGKHGVAQEEIEAVFRAPSLRIMPMRHAEERFAAFAMSSSGRWATIIFTWRGRLIRPISARYMHAKDVLRNVT